jgi:putative membrane protein
MKRLILHLFAGIIGLWLATLIVPGVKIEIIPNVSAIFGIQLTAFWQILILIGSVLGLINFFIKPILNTITLPLRILTLGLFGLIINIIIIWIIDLLFPELIIIGFIPLFWTAIIIWFISFILRAYKKR